MSISIIFPIEVGDNGQAVTNTSSSRVTSTSFGAASYADWSQTDAIKQNLKMLLLTRPGEYVMDANYGVGLPDYLFLQEQEIDTGALESRIKSQASDYMPYMTISNLEVTLDPINSMMRIRIEFFYNELSIPEVFELEVI
jgi:phage baseplate assembly protein W